MIKQLHNHDAAMIEVEFVELYIGYGESMKFIGSFV